VSNSVAQRRTQEERRSESERRLLDAAITLIARKGSAGTTLAEIGLAAGYSRGLPSGLYGTKTALLHALVERAEETFKEQLAHDIGGKTGMKAVEARISAHLSSLVRSPDRARCIHLLYMESQTIVPELRDRIAALGQLYRAGFVQNLREARAAGEIRGGVNLENIAIVMLGTLRGILTQAMIAPAAIDVAASKSIVLGMVRSYLQPMMSAK
jgi:AcrR family transcriptional regulator